MLIGEITDVKIYGKSTEGEDIEIHVGVDNIKEADLQAVWEDGRPVEFKISVPFLKLDIFVSGETDNSDVDIDISSDELDSFLEQFERQKED